ncbi:SIR2 family histone deacetylase [Coccidioides immitis RS]|uniref:NAD-dependent protein deacetylase n=4 Tax=Coccidioides immitis TaxID=5501 RepID=J3KI73_COCIM|nr:SIR2 family histone deacetylase [Coccidioides immitis RS]KMP00912.1 NAD-dependent deacetylase sirtuin-2 [Coccidioides immitis RMSCC 2394]KMU72852.1 NAD-dependent deacetylase sirtuin-2 [Coccidioides immitis RMSCC 3703]KMU83422.1 NAD-dependent deacetylase sirtuin-2 [Coccidioides immitis H538.4]TPX26129.1 Sir2 histone deacetylase Hst2 [Coccidioides immitis]EAS35645.3 SIR2 family histone deacetylase [Coccidioides immitis RS]
MGNESSIMVDDDVRPQALESRTLEAVAKYIHEKNARKIVVMVGAGISTAAGIPDFRSPDTGLYANLARLNLPTPEAVFDIQYFRTDPRPFYALTKEMLPGKCKPTITHSFIKLLYNKGRLLKLFTQNIDCLEREAGIPSEMIVEAHGTFATQSCIECKTPYPGELMTKAMEANDVPLCPECMNLVKPDVVFFGEALPSSFFLNRTLPAAADLCIVMGTSLSVQPFSSLPSLCREGIPRLLINLTQAGGLGSRPDDVLLLGECDDGVMKLADALGWRQELEELWATVNPEKAAAIASKEQKSTPITRDDQLREEVEKLTEEVEHALDISQAHEERVRAQLQEMKAKQDRGVEEPEDAQSRQVGSTSPGEPDGIKHANNPTQNGAIAATEQNTAEQQPERSKQDSSL